MGLILIIFLLLVLTGAVHFSGVLAASAVAVALPIVLVILVISLILSVLRHIFSLGGPTPPVDGPY